MKEDENMVTLNMSLGMYLKKLRKGSTFSLNEVESRTLIAKGMLSEYENDKHIPNEHNLQKLAELYDVDIAEFYHFIQLRGIPIVEQASLEQVFHNKGDIQNKIVFDAAVFPLKSIDQYYFTKKTLRDLDAVGIPQGSLVLYRYTDTIAQNKIGIFGIKDTLVMRQIQYINEHEAYLLPRSTDKKYKKKKVKLKDIRILAQVEKVILDFT